MRTPALKTSPPAGDRWIFAGLLLLLLWLPLPWGSKPEAAAALLGFAAGFLVLARAVAVKVPLPPLPLAARIALWLWASWLAWIALQLLPLPAGWGARLSPEAFEHHSALGLIGQADALLPLSILPGAGADRLLLSMAYFALFWLTLVSVTHNRARQRLLLTIVVIAGLAQGLYSIVMTLSGLEYGFLEPKRYNLGIATGTFVNRNHLAGYLELTLAAGIALILADLRPAAAEGWRARVAAWLEIAMSRRMRIRIMMLVMVVALVLTRSRAGNIAFFASLLVCGCIYMFLRHKEVFGRSLIFFLSLVLVDLLVVSDRFGLDKLAQRLEATDWEAEQRSQVFDELGTVVDRFWLTGSGLGTFASAYAPHQSARVVGYVDHAHNDHLQFLIETGTLGYGLLALLAGTVLLHGLLVVVRRSDPMACALGFVGPMALVSLGLHGLLDFNLQIPANAALLVTLMAASLSCSSVSQQRGRRGVHPPTDDSTPIAAEH